MLCDEFNLAVACASGSWSRLCTRSPSFSHSGDTVHGSAHPLSNQVSNKPRKDINLGNWAHLSKTRYNLQMHLLQTIEDVRTLQPSHSFFTLLRTFIPLDCSNLVFLSAYTTGLLLNPPNTRPSPCHIDSRVAGWDVKYVLCIDRIVAFDKRQENDMREGLDIADSARRASRGCSMMKLSETGGRQGLLVGYEMWQST